MLSILELCEHLTNIIHTPIRCYNKNKLENYNVQQDPLIADKEFEQMLLCKANENFPVLHFEFESIIYGIIKNKEYTFIIGPCSLIKDSRFIMDKFIKAHKLDNKIPYKIKFCSQETFCSSCAMLFHHISGQKLNWNEVFMLNECDNINNMEKQLSNRFFDYYEQTKIHNPYEQEEREQESIRSGNVENLKKSFTETYTGEIGTLSKDALRHTKNLAIVLITLASRSAIKGGVPYEIAFSLSDAYILQAEDARTPSEAGFIGRQAEIHYANLVNEYKKNQNPLVLKCKEQIQQRLHQKITVNELAEMLDTTPNYLTQVFKKNTGCNLSDYILNEKIEQAKKRLKYSNDGYDIIAYAFGFCSQSHFTNIFKKIVGVTPKQYRDSNL